MSAFGFPMQVGISQIVRDVWQPAQRRWVTYLCCSSLSVQWCSQATPSCFLSRELLQAGSVVGIAWMMGEINFDWATKMLKARRFPNEGTKKSMEVPESYEILSDDRCNISLWPSKLFAECLCSLNCETFTTKGIFLPSQWVSSALHLSFEVNPQWHPTLYN